MLYYGHWLLGINIKNRQTALERLPVIIAQLLLTRAIKIRLVFRSHVVGGDRRINTWY